MLPEHPPGTTASGAPPPRDAAARLETLGRPALFALALAGVVGLGVLDYLTGYELSFSVFYLFPVALAAFSLGRGPGLGIALLGAVTWHIANRLAGEAFSSPAIPYWNTATRLGFFVVITELLVRLREAFDRLRDATRVDFLTGALNSRGFYEIAGAELVRLRRYGRPLTAVYLDLDRFKEVNDTLGHLAGDQVLRCVAQAMRETIRGADSLARLGGDEFALLLPETDAAEARRLLPRLRVAILETVSRERWPVTVSVGAVTCTAAPPGVDVLVRLADALMYEAKEAGRDAIRYTLYEGEPDARASASSSSAATRAASP
jgi:diguanylate cyclase (GGDEF)-like protein